MTRLLSTLSFGRRAAAHLDTGAKFSEALERAMIVDILETMDQHDAARFFVVGAYQTIKSLVGQLRLLRNHTVRARPALWYAPSGDFAKSFASLKLNPLEDAIPEVCALRYDNGTRGAYDKSKTANLRKVLTGGASHLLLSAGTEDDRHGKTACDLYLDEVHTYDTGWIAQISNRRGDYSEQFTETFMSTGLTAGTEAALLWDSTDQRTWHVRCPACQKLFEPRYLHRDPATDQILGGLRYEKHYLDNGLPDATRIAATLVHECPRCHHTLPDTIGSRDLLSGTARAPRGLYVSKNDRAAPRTFGWNFNAIAVRPWLPIVVRFEIAMLAFKRGDLTPLADWIREEMGGIWNPLDHLTGSKLRPKGDYKMGEPWPAELLDGRRHPMREAGIDVQLDHFVMCSRKWGANSESRLHHAEKITTEGILADRIQSLGIPPNRVFVDARHEKERVRRMCSRYGWMTMMGEREKDYPWPDLGVRRIYSEPQPIDPWSGTHSQGQVKILEFKFSKASALDRLHLLRTFKTNDGRPLWTGAADAPEWYWSEVDAYHPTRKQSADGTFYREWTQHAVDDHAASCEIQNIVGASIAGLIGAESLEPPSTPKNS